MQQTQQIISKLRNARFQPPGGAPKEKLAFINDGEADLLRSIGGAGRMTRHGVRSYFPSGGNDPRGRGGTGFGNASDRMSNGMGGTTSSGDARGLDFRGNDPRAGYAGDTNRVGMPVQARPAITPAMALPPVSALPPAMPPVSGPKYRPDLNAATLARWRGVGLDPLARFRNPKGNYPAQYNGGGPGASFSPRGVSYGPPGGGKFQDRVPGMDNGFGRVGGGRGGGGGGGW